jgi:hypothetical protein
MFLEILLLARARLPNLRDLDVECLDLVRDFRTLIPLGYNERSPIFSETVEERLS